MRKEAYYFSHDSNARNDEKMLAVRMRLGTEGYGIYFMIIERLRDESDYMSIKDYNVLAFDFRVSADKVKSVIEDFGLFEFSEDKKYFYSRRLINSMQVKSEKSEKARVSAGKRWNKSESDANAMRTHSDSNAIKVKESKVKESKVNEIVKEIDKENPTTTSTSLDFHLEKPIKDQMKLYFSEVNYQETIDVLAMKYAKLSDSKESKINLLKYWAIDFANKQIEAGKPNKTLKDFAEHFANWMAKQDVNNYPVSTNKSHLNPTQDASYWKQKSIKCAQQAVENRKIKNRDDSSTGN